MAIPRLFLVILCLLLPAALSAADQAAINSICPVTGKAVDATIPPVIVTVGKGERAQRVLIGVADRAAADKVKANPSAYVESAKANRKAP
jgi:hypothetical protein